jgi:hypothetical protein
MSIQGWIKNMREYTNKLLEMVEEGLLDKDMVIMACMKYMSEDDVKGMMEANEMIEDEEEEDEEDLLDNFNYVGSRHHY